MVLPDWNVRRMIARVPDFKGFRSWCYAGTDEGNAWTCLFEPLFGLSDSEMDDARILYENASTPACTFNEDREPLLTYVHAYKLYRLPSFDAWRRQYHRVFRDHIKLRPELEAQIAAEKKRLNSCLMIGAHVRHPDHVREQPTEHMADTGDYISAVREQVTRRGMAMKSDDWRVFLATDQERVVRQFVSAFGERLRFFRDVKRTSSDDDFRYNALSVEARKEEGHQLQHHAAAAPERWSSRMAWEVFRDAAMLAHCHVLLHVTSNVSTAVSYMNPSVEMIYCDFKRST